MSQEEQRPQFTPLAVAELTGENNRPMASVQFGQIIGIDTCYDGFEVIILLQGGSQASIPCNDAEHVERLARTVMQGWKGYLDFLEGERQKQVDMMRGAGILTPGGMR